MFQNLSLTLRSVVVFRVRSPLTKKVNMALSEVPYSFPVEQVGAEGEDEQAVVIVESG